MVKDSQQQTNKMCQQKYIAQKKVREHLIITVLHKANETSGPLSKALNPTLLQVEMSPA